MNCCAARRRDDESLPTNKHLGDGSNIRSLEGCERWTPGGNYGHIGATLANAVLQSKTADYLKILVGLDEEAVDRHLLAFLERAGLGRLNYERSKEVVHRTADLMGWERAHLDHSIWRYMTGGKRR